MFEFFKKDQTKSGNNQEQTTALVLSEHTGNAIVFLYDEVDSDLWYDLAPHINTLELIRKLCSSHSSPGHIQGFGISSKSLSEKPESAPELEQLQQGFRIGF